MFSVGDRVCRINSQLDTGTVIEAYERGVYTVKWDGVLEFEETVLGYEIKPARKTA